VREACGRRGRTARGPVGRGGPVGEFARQLWELKRAAGDPSYDRMRDELGALASKSALSAAARGDRLPSWDTAWEFARVLSVGVLGQDEQRARRQWRAAWERADATAAVANPFGKPANTPPRPPDPEPRPPEPRQPVQSQPQPHREPTGEPRQPDPHRYYGPALVAVAAAVVGFSLGRRLR
jgi:hypothetical protein